ncbi:MAG: peptide chain release factor N(5)-glutamine methyltransferase [Chloracidobacterium sp.]|nr:peptide chain release factor N(5)-glutamine methyltransferase [Chloracidobacterium sp.]
MTIAEALKEASECLRASSAPNDLLDAQTLMSEAGGFDRTYLIINRNKQAPENLLAKFRAMVNRRAAGEPLQYITGHQEFFGLDFEVTPDVLIPRPETELIVEETIRIVQQEGRWEGIARPVIVDVGAGSGAIAVALARELGEARVVASDISEAALRVARRNASRHGLAARIAFAASDLLAAFAEDHFADFILSNPPYVSEEEMPLLQREVRDWEPRLALTDSSKDGLSFYYRLLKDAPSRLKPGGYLICEMGHTQSERILAMVNHQVWGVERLLDDLQGITRTIVLRKL